MKKITKLFCVFAIAALMAGCKQNADPEDPSQNSADSTQQNGGSGNSGKDDGKKDNNNSASSIFDLPANVGTDELKNLTVFNRWGSTKLVFNNDGTLSLYNKDKNDFFLDEIDSYSYDSINKIYTRKPYKVNCYFFFDDGDDHLLTYEEFTVLIKSLFDANYAKSIFMAQLKSDEGVLMRSLLGLTEESTEEEVLDALIEFSQENYELMGLDGPVTSWDDMAKTFQNSYSKEFEDEYKEKISYKYEITESGVNFIPLITAVKFEDYFALREKGWFKKEKSEYAYDSLKHNYVDIQLNDSDDLPVRFHFDEVKGNIIKARFKDYTTSEYISVDLTYTADFTKPQGEKTVSITYEGKTYDFIQCIDPEEYTFTEPTLE